MEQPESNPRFCTNNCGFYGSSQFEGMCSKCYRDHASRSYNAGQTDSFPSYYASSNTPAIPSASLLSNGVEQTPDEQDEIIGHLDEDSHAVSSTMESNPTETTVAEEMDSSSSSDLLPHIASALTLPITSSNNIDIPTLNDSNSASSTLESSSLDASSTSIEKKKRIRCSWGTCNKKLGLTGFQCRCGGQYCSLHRYANEHQCTFDYKEYGQNEIRKNMPVVTAERVRRI